MTFALERERPRSAAAVEGERICIAVIEDDTGAADRRPAQAHAEVDARPGQPGHVTHVGVEAALREAGVGRRRDGDLHGADEGPRLHCGCVPARLGRWRVHAVLEGPAHVDGGVRERSVGVWPELDGLHVLLAILAERQRDGLRRLASCRTDTDLERVALDELHVARRDGQPERGGALKRGAGCQEALGSIHEGAGRDEPKEEEADDGKRGQARGLPGAAKVFNLLEGHRLHLAAQALHGLVHELTRRSGAAPVYEVEEIDEPVAHLGEGLANLVRHVLLRGALKQTDELEEGPGQEVPGADEHARTHDTHDGRPRGGGQPEAGFEQGREKPSGCQDAERNSRAKSQAGQRDAAKRLAEPLAEPIDEAKGLLAHGAQGTQG